MKLFIILFIILVSFSCGDDKTPNTDRSLETFPFSSAADESYLEGPRQFGACRTEDCSRLHAGVDLYGHVGRPIYAVKDGTILDKYYFYDGTFALVVDHGSFIVRYGEILEYTPEQASVGSAVHGGQHIGYVGDLESLRYNMLHFERFSGEATGPLTDRSNAPYQRRWDLENPTSDLLRWPYPDFN